MNLSVTPQSNNAGYNILRHYGESERLCREKERRQITSVSRTQAWKLEQKGLFPKRRKIGSTNAWLLSDLLLWVSNLSTEIK